jgi:HEAT repeat protein
VIHYALGLALPALIKLLEHKDSDVGMAAADLLGKFAEQGKR